MLASCGRMSQRTAGTTWGWRTPVCVRVSACVRALVCSGGKWNTAKFKPRPFPPPLPAPLLAASVALQERKLICFPALSSSHSSSILTPQGLGVAGIFSCSVPKGQHQAPSPLETLRGRSSRDVWGLVGVREETPPLLQPVFSSAGYPSPSGHAEEWHSCSRQVLSLEWRVPSGAGGHQPALAFSRWAGFNPQAPGVTQKTNVFCKLLLQELRDQATNHGAPTATLSSLN